MAVFFIFVLRKIAMKFDPYPLQIPDVFYGWPQIAKLSPASHTRASWQSGIRYMCGLRPWGPWALLRFFSRYELEKAIQKYRYALIRLDTLKKFKSAFSCNLNIRHEIKAPKILFFLPLYDFTTI